MATSTAVDQSALARTVGIQTKYLDLRAGRVVYLPQQVTLIGQGNSAETYDTSAELFTSAYDVGSTFGFGSPLHRSALQLLPSNGDGLGTIPLRIIALVDNISGATPSVGTIEPSGAATASGAFRVIVNGTPSEYFQVYSGMVPGDFIAQITSAINAVLSLPVIATDDGTTVTLTSKWAGQSANDIWFTIEGPTIGITFANTMPTGGSVNPAVGATFVALDSLGWQTMVINCLDPADSDWLNSYQDFGESRWLPSVRRPFVAFTGSGAVTLGEGQSYTSGREDDRVNCLMFATDSKSLPCEIASRAVARIAKQANNNPPHDYARKVLSGLSPGFAANQWNYETRDLAVKSGMSTTVLISDEVTLDNTVTCYFPAGDPTPAYRKVVTIVKLQQVLFNLDLIFNSDTWAGAPLIPNDQATTNKTAKQPKDAVSSIAAMIDSLALEAIISDPQTAKNSIQANISTSNPDRLDVSFTVQLSANTDIISIDFNFGFYFGEASVTV